MSTELQSYLEAEVAEASKSFKIGVVTMIVLAVVIFGYFSWMRSKTAEILEPEFLAEMMTNEIRRNLPAAREGLQKSLTDAAPDVVNFVMQTVVDEALPMVTEAARALFGEYSRELANFGTLAAAQAFEQVVAAHKVELAKAADVGEQGMYTPDVISEKLSDAMKSELSQRITELPEESTAVKLDESLNALKNINSRLAYLSKAKNSDLSRRDAMGKKLITTWWTFLNRNDGPETAEQRMMEHLVQMPITTGQEPMVMGDGTEDENQ